ncbi:MAG: orotidine-5'-phosphate decarboxylase [Candidatus Omnitrophica bacterium]|nr:orotidine-5'-phosphate decarboxylase [Candidatus Omnitrophota bacterium]MDD5670984.1 orotidine-5'-phosphate decarboxylase [Candidatus Omnitrophota bacterium]
MGNISDRLIVALDSSDLEGVQKLLENLKGIITFYKVGFELFVSQGWKAVDLVHQFGAKVFLDLKLHDIPNTVKKTTEAICEHHVEMFNVHASGGLEMMQSTADAVQKATRGRKTKPIVIGVTVLTSLNQDQLTQELGISRNVQDQVLALARLTRTAGLNGVVSSPQEIAALRNEFPRDFVIVTPGIRPEGSSKSDQKRICTPKEAFVSGADYIVIGRPISGVADPRMSALDILTSIGTLDDI